MKLNNKKVLAFDSTNNTVGYVAVAGNEPFGGARQDGTIGQSIRIKTEGNITVIAGGTVVTDDSLISDTTGRVVASAVAGKWQIGKATAGATVGQELTIAVDIKQIS